jgi:hypothetical protein
MKTQPTTACEPCRAVKTLRPAQAGTPKLQRRYGDGLLCVMYREDASGTTRCTTVERVVDTAPVQRRLTDRTIVGMRIAWGETSLSARAKSMGAKWDSSARLWRMTFKLARHLELTDRIRPKLGIDRQHL